MFVSTHTSYLLYPNSSETMFNLTYTEKDFSCMSKSQIQIEFAELFPMFLELRLKPDELFKIIEQIPMNKLPKFQRETLGYSFSVSLKKKKINEINDFNKKSSQYIWTFEAFDGKIVLLPEFIEIRNFTDKDLKNSILEFSKVWKYI